MYASLMALRARLSTSAGVRARVRVRKCGLRVLGASAVRRCIYLRGSGADPAHKHSSPSQWAPPRPPETQSCHSYLDTHLDALTAILCTLHTAINTLTCDYAGNYENVSTEAREECEAHNHSPEWNIKIFVLLRWRATSSLIMERDSKAHTGLSSFLLGEILASLHHRWKSLNRRRRCLPSQPPPPPHPPSF